MIVELVIALQAATTDPLEQACYDKDHSQIAMTMCARDAFERADAELNRRWKALLAAYKDDPAGRKILVEAQRGWIAYRDGHCEMVAYDSRGGSMHPMVLQGCQADLTRIRVKELVDLMGQGE
jgi:uncharacterized protein YecT (DUF1311 family)